MTRRAIVIGWLAVNDTALHCIQRRRSEDRESWSLVAMDKWR